MRRTSTEKTPSRRASTEKVPRRMESTEKGYRRPSLSAESSKPDECDGQGLESSNPTQTSQTNEAVTDMTNATQPACSPSTHHHMKHTTSVDSFLSSSHTYNTTGKKSAKLPVKTIVVRSLSLGWPNEGITPVVSQLGWAREDITPVVSQEGIPAAQQKTPHTTSISGHIKHSDLKQSRSSSQVDDNLNSPSDKGYVLDFGGFKSPPPQTNILPPLQQGIFPPPYTTTPNSQAFKTKATETPRSLQEPPPQQMKASLPNEAPQVKKSQYVQDTRASAPQLYKATPIQPSPSHTSSEEGISVAPQRSMACLVEQDTSTPQNDRTVQSKHHIQPLPPSHHHHNQPLPTSSQPPPAPQHHSPLLLSTSPRQNYNQPQQSVTALLPEQQRNHHVILLPKAHRRNKSYPAMVVFEEQSQLSAGHHAGHRTMEGKGWPSSLTCSGLLSIKEEGAWSPVHSMDPDNGTSSM